MGTIKTIQHSFYEQIQRFFLWFSTGSGNWRERLFLALGRALLIFSLPTMVSSILFSFHNKDWFLVLVYILVYGSLFFLMLFPKLPFGIRVHGFNIILFSLTLISFFAHGLEGSGRVYLFFFVVNIGLFLGLWAGIISFIMSAGVFVLFGWLLYVGQIPAGWAQTTTLDVWINVSLTFFALSTALTVVLSLFVRFLESALTQEMVLSDNLRTTNQQLRIEMKERETAESTIQVQQEQFRVILDNFPEAVFVCDPKTYRIAFINQAFTNFLIKSGINDDAYSKPCYQVLQGLGHPCEFCLDPSKPIDNDHQNMWEYYNPLLKRHYQVSERLISWPGGKKMRMEVAIDITDRKYAENQLKHDALHDSLTGLPNRALLMERLNHAISLARRDPDSRFALIFLDLDQFKLVNDTHGHSLGDQMLIEAGKRLIEKVREVDMVSRLGGDEFVILLEQLADEQDVFIIANRVLSVLSAPFTFNGNHIITTASMGIFMGNVQELTPEDVIRDADIALYQAKADGRNQYVVFDQNMRQIIQERSILERDLRQAIDSNEFEVYYQPLLFMKDSSIAGFEALVRWNHPVKGVLSPGSFLQVAEELGLTLPMGQYVIRESIKQLKLWQQTMQCDPPLKLSINLSPKQLLAEGMLAYLKKNLDQYSINPANINIEITEDLVMTQFQVVSEILTALRALGVQIHLDDFGKEYSSLGKLQVLTFDALKIDRGFVKDFFVKERGVEIVKTIVALAKEFQLSCVAEGVETQEQLTWLKKLDCDYWQGYLFSPPVPVDQIEPMLQKEMLHRKQ